MNCPHKRKQEPEYNSTTLLRPTHTFLCRLMNCQVLSFVSMTTNKLFCIANPQGLLDSKKICIYCIYDIYWYGCTKGKKGKKRLNICLIETVFWNIPHSRLELLRGNDARHDGSRWWRSWIPDKCNQSYHTNRLRAARWIRFPSRCLSAIISLRDACDQRAIGGVETSDWN